MDSTFYFIGVTTGKSSSRRMFPAWMNFLGRPEIKWVGVDLPPHAEAARYREVVTRIKEDPTVVGALVTTHKIDLLEASRDLFDELGPFATLCGEVSSISKRNGKLWGHATDPIAGGRSLDALLPDGYFGRSGGHLLCFGAGGSATALALHLMRHEKAADRPSRFVVVNRSRTRLDALRRLVENEDSDIEFEFILNQDPAVNDKLMADLPEGSVVVNATGMGKDRPGSPVTQAGLFPHRGVAWELNYRGELDFLHQARSQESDRQLTVEDGWIYFVNGWAMVLAYALHVEIDQAMLADLGRLAAAIR
jgi:shikimate 5-dehydrogenase